MALAALLAVATPTLTHAAPLTDSAERTVEIPADVASVVPGGAPAQVLLHALVPAKLTGLVEAFGPGHAIYVAARLAALPQIPMLTRTDAPGDVAAVAALKPGLSVDYGDVSARYVAADEKIQEELKTPAVIFGGRLAASGAVVTALGRALGASDRGTAIATLAQGVLDAVKPVSALPDSERVTVYMARGADGLQAARAGTSFDEPIRLAGGMNVVVGGGGTFKRMQVEDVVALKPSVVIFGSPEALSSPLHEALPKGTRFVVDTGEPYKVLLGPPSLNRLAGLAALAPILHPDRVKPDDSARAIETDLFAIPAGVTVPAPLQVQP
jgi:iron complex transport system substrate-binding protein